MHSPYSLSLLSIRQIPFYRLHFRSTSELPEADSVPAIQRRIPEFRLHQHQSGYRHMPWVKDLYDQRKQKIERVFADAKVKHGLRFTQLRGLAKVTMQVTLLLRA